ncbi:MAG: phosphoribosylanthranilate isomerase [marine benthic group bacterium]|nr:phosphoribosylanthranilate isomerase [Gemmatimonadota bacterium]MCL7938684.1 phosphoribosylanthranilate isomerase [Gemmatimonadota bacterium]MCL7969616.1 phosphoribosylanthranilate isomerase [Gemmatimonadota bacterium]MCL7978014.1 phosphoribosylanthranilate isomerase [Gemmatimonadota bacterium]
MQIVPPVKVKVCCITSVEEAQIAVSYGVAAIGMVDETPTGEGRVAVGQIAEIVRSVPDSIGTFVLTSATDARQLADLYVETGVKTLQLWDPLASEDYQKLRSAFPGIFIAQSIHVIESDAPDVARRVSRHVDALVLDSGRSEPPFRWQNPAGETHDWEISRAISDSIQLPVLLAGGLNAENVCQAVRVVRPYGVDVCSGVRKDGRLDRSLLVAFLETVSRPQCAD